MRHYLAGDLSLTGTRRTARTPARRFLMSDEIRETINTLWNVIYGFGALMLGIIGYAFKAGGRNKELVTHSELDKRLETYARKDQIEELKADIGEVKQGQIEERRVNEARHQQLMTALLSRGKE